MNRDGRASSHDPTAERTAVRSTQSAGGLSAGRRPGGERGLEGELVNRTEPDLTPRRYDQPLEEDHVPDGGRAD